MGESGRGEREGKESKEKRNAFPHLFNPTLTTASNIVKVTIKVTVRDRVVSSRVSYVQYLEKCSVQLTCIN